MPRKPTGSVAERKGKDGITYALRFRAYGKREYQTLGSRAEGWTQEKAEAELRHVMSDVERGIWQARTPAPEPQDDPTFHEFSSDWLRQRKPELRPRTMDDYKWALVSHLLPFFANYQLSEIDAAMVDRYKAEKLREGQLGPAQVNKTLKRLSQVLELAVDYGHLAANPAASTGGRRRVKEPKPQRSWVEPEQLMALLDGASRYMRPMLATLAGAGLRVSEACELDWRDVNLATGTLTVRSAKTDAGAGREIDLPGGLLSELKMLKARTPQAPAGSPVFVSDHREVRRQTSANVARRLKTAIKGANVKLTEAGIEPISDRVTPHSLRRTYASMRAALRDDPVYISESLGHTNPTFTFRVYAKATKRREKLSGAYLRAFDSALDWARMGTSGDFELEPTRVAGDREGQNTAL